MEGNHKLKGIRSLLQEWYWPEEEKKNLKGGSRGGKRTGSQVDRELTQWTREGRYEFLPTRKIHPYTTKLINAFKAWGWRPVSAQHPVGTKAFGSVATAIDLIVKNEQGDIILVEIKCGYDGYWEKPNGQFAAPFADIPNTPCGQAMAQLIFGHFLLTRTQPHIVPKFAYVVNANKSGVTRHAASTFEWGKRLIIDLHKRIQLRIDGQRPPPRVPAPAPAPARARTPRKRQTSTTTPPPPSKRNKPRHHEVIVLD